jgi:hypothetical protein
VAAELVFGSDEELLVFVAAAPRIFAGHETPDHPALADAAGRERRAGGAGQVEVFVFGEAFGSKSGGFECRVGIQCDEKPALLAR